MINNKARHKEYTNFMRGEFANQIRRKALEHDLRTSSIAMKEEDSVIKYCFSIEDTIVDITYAKKSTELFVTTMHFKTKEDTALDSVREVLEDCFGKPSLSYDNDFSYSNLIIGHNLEWPVKGDEKQAIEDLRKGMGIAPGIFVYNIKDLTNNQAADEGQK